MRYLKFKSKNIEFYFSEHQKEVRNSLLKAEPFDTFITYSYTAHSKPRPREVKIPKNKIDKFVLNEHTGKWQEFTESVPQGHYNFSINHNGVKAFYITPNPKIYHFNHTTGKYTFIEGDTYQDITKDKLDSMAALATAELKR